MKKFEVIVFFVTLAHIDGSISKIDVGENFDNDDTTELLPVMPPQTSGSSWTHIYPGTKWCGKGHIAKHYDDLGRFKLTDACCRDHDNCPEKVRSGETNYGIHNNGSITILSCRCDQIFYDCLKNIHTRSGDIIGSIYFDFVGNRCFKKSEGKREEFVLTNGPHFTNNKAIEWMSNLWTSMHG